MDVQAVQVVSGPIGRNGRRVHIRQDGLFNFEL